MNFIPKNTKIKISELGEQRSFVSGNKYHFIEWAEFKGVTFKEGVMVKWKCPDEKITYKGKIQWLIILDNGDVQISIDAPIGRLDLDEVSLIK